MSKGGFDVEQPQWAVNIIILNPSVVAWQSRDNSQSYAVFSLFYFFPSSLVQEN
jgi:hypothetical protein